MQTQTPVVRPRARIVVGVDGSEPSEDALRWAVATARVWRADLEVVTAWRPRLAPFGAAVVLAPWDPRRDADTVARGVVDRVLDPQRPATLTVEAVEGHAGAVLTDRARGADLLVVGSRGHGGFAELALGSVSRHCVEHASCPVVVVRPARVAERAPAPVGVGPAVAAT